MTVVAFFIALAVVAVLVAAPLTFFAMLFAGNMGWNLGFWTLFPGAVAVKLVTTNLAGVKDGK